MKPSDLSGEWISTSKDRPEQSRTYITEQFTLFGFVEGPFPNQSTCYWYLAYQPKINNENDHGIIACGNTDWPSMLPGNEFDCAKSRCNKAAAVIITMLEELGVSLPRDAR